MRLTSIKARLLLCLGLLALALVAVGGSGFVALRLSADKTYTIVVDRVIPLDQLKQVADHYAIDVVDTAHKVRSGALSWEDGKKNIDLAMADINKQWSGYASSQMSAEEKQMADKAQAAMSAAEPAITKLASILSDLDATALSIFVDKELYPATAPIDAAIDGLSKLQTEIARSEFEAAEALQGTSLIVMGIIAAISLGILAFAIKVVLSGVAKPLRAMQVVMGTYAEGDFSEQVPFADRRDEIGEMAKAVAVFRQNGLQVARLAEEELGRAKSAASRAQMMENFQHAFDAAVSATLEGDFTKRINAKFADPDIDQIAANFDTLLETVNGGLTEAGRVLGALSDTDLTQRVEGNYKGCFAKLKEDINTVADKLTNVVSQLKDTSKALKSATGEILAGANDLAERTTKQAAAIEETSAAMEQLANTVTDNARKAEDAAVKTQSAAQLADEGGQVMNQATEAMERITSSSAKISNIIGMIDDIAFQTNLLALNASVEAARAGEAGKGFAVVAIEVRRLAQSAAQASSEVKQLIEQSAQEVGSGSKLVANAAQKLEAILQSVQENSALMTGISGASKEQSSAIGEVTSAVRQMDEMTQHNAALVEEINASIEQTETQASELDRVVDVFRIDENSGSPVARAPSQAAPKPSAPAKGGIRALQEKVKAAAKSYLSHGNAAVKEEWSEF